MPGVKMHMLDSSHSAYSGLVNYEFLGTQIPSHGIAPSLWSLQGPLWGPRGGGCVAHIGPGWPRGPPKRGRLGGCGAERGWVPLGLS